MSFTLASQSVIRFESSTARLGDEWQRTLMFFNVDISGGVHCDHPNEITAPRIQERNGKQRNPGGGLSNPIRECAMPFGKPYEFRAQSRDDFDRRGSRPRRRSLGGRRRNSLYSDSRRHLQYRSAKPRWNLIDTAPFTHFPTQNSAHRYVPPDYESDNGYDEGYSNRCKHKSYQDEEYDPPSQISRDLTYSEDARESRDRYNTESYTDSSYESPPDYYPMERPKRESYQRSYEPPPYRNRSSYYSEERFSNDFNPKGRDSLSQLNMFRPRGKQRQASGSILPEHNVDYSDIYQYSNEQKDYKNKESYDRYQESKDSDYEYEDSQPPPELGNKVRYSSKKRFGYEDYGEKRVRPPPLTNPKPKAKYRSECRTPYKYRDKGYSISQPRNYKTDGERYKNADGPGKLSRQLHEPRHRNIEPCPTESGIYHRNRSRRHSRLEKVLQYCTPFKKAREASAQYNRISKQILGLGLPKMNENNPKATGTVPRRKFNFTVEEIPQPYKKYLKKETSRSNHHILFNDEIPRRQRNLTRELSVNFGNTSPSKMFDEQEGKSKQNFSSDKKKLFDFGAEIPYRFWKSAAPSSMLFVDDIPFRKKERMRYSSANIKSDSNSDLGIAYSISAARLRRDPTKKRVSLYEVRNHRQPRSIKQKISGFLKMSKKNHKRSSSFKDKMKKIKTERQDDQEEEDNLIRGKSKTRFVPDSPKLKPKSKTKAKSQSKSESRSTSVTRGSKTSKQEKTPEQKQSDLTKPSLTNKTYRCLSKIGTGGHYPTVFRGKNVNEENETACNFLCSMRNSKSNHSDRISSGNCSLNNYVTKPQPILIDEKNVCANCAGTASLSENLTIVPSQENGDQCCDTKLIKPQAEPQAEAQAEDQAEGEAETESESSCESIPISMQISINENHFKNVRFSPVPSICQSPSSSSDSSQNSSNEGLVCSRTTLINRQNIETCSKPPEIMQSTSSEEGCTCPRRRLCANWSLTRKSCCSHNSNHNTLECNRCRPARPGLCLPNNIEMSSSPPVVVHELNKKSSLKGPNTKPEGTSNRRVCLKVNSSSSGSENSDEYSANSITMCPCYFEENTGINDGCPCCNPISENHYMDKPKIQKSLYNIGEIDNTEICRCQHNFEEQQIEIQPRSCNCGKTTKANKIPSCPVKKSLYNIGEIDNIEIYRCQPNFEEQQIEVQPRSCNCGKTTKAIDTIPFSPPKCTNDNDTNPGCSGKSFNTEVVCTGCNAKRKSNIEKPKSHRTQCTIDDLGEEHTIELKTKVSSCGKSITINHTIPTSPGKSVNIDIKSPGCNAKKETVNTGKCKSQTTQNQGTCSNGEDNTEKCKSQTTQNQGTCSNGEDRNPEKKATPCPTENPTSPQPQNASSCCVPKEPFELPAATMSECSKNSIQTNSKCSMDNMQLVCLPNSSYAPCSTCPNYGNRNFIPTYRPSNLSNITCNDCPDTVHKRDLISGWAEENACGKNIVEELKRELMNTFRKEREIESQCSRMRQPQHIMFFPCPPHPMMRPNTFYTPDSVVCWAACSKPPPPF